MTSIVTYVLLLVQLTVANVEKVIFVHPHHQPNLPDDLVFDDLGIHHLSPSIPITRTYLNASFPTKDKQLGTDSWFYLDNLVPGTRYEVRVCWLATVCSPIDGLYQENSSHHDSRHLIRRIAYERWNS